MYELDGELLSVEELNQVASLKGYTLEKLLQKNPEIKKVDDTEGKLKSQGQGAPVAETAAPEIQAQSMESSLEDGSLELQEISLQEKKKLPYAIRQQLTREQDFSVKRVNELTKDINKKSEIKAVPPIVKEGKMLAKDLDRVSELNNIIIGNSKDESLILNNITDKDQQVKMIQELQNDAKKELELIKKRNPGILEAIEQIQKDTEAYNADSAFTDLFKVFSFGSAKNEEANETLNLSSEVKTELINVLKEKNIPLEKASQGRLSLEEKENIINTSKVNVLNRVIKEESDTYAQTYSKKAEELKALNSQIDAIEPNSQQALDYKNKLINKYNNLLNKTKLENEDFTKNIQGLQSKYVIESGGKVLKNFAKSKEREEEGTKLDASPNLNAFYAFSNEMYSMVKKGAVGIPSMILKTADAITETITGEDKYSYIDAFTDQLNAFASTGLGLPQSDNFKIVDDKGNYNITRANAINTFAEALPFSLLIMAEASKGNLNSATKMLSKAYKGGKFLTPSVKQDLLLAQGAFKATISDNIKEGEDAGLNKLQALAYGNLTSIGEGVVQSIMPDSQIVKAGTKAVKAGLFNNLKNAANKKAISNAAKTYFTNIGKEIFEEESMLALSDLIKITSGISVEENGFTDIIAQKNLAASTVILSGGLGSIGARADFKRTKDLIYKDVIKQSNGVLDALKTQIASLPRNQNNEVLPEYVEQEKALQEARIFATDLVRASKIAPENVSSDQLDLLIEKQKLIDKKSNLDSAFHESVNKEIAEIDKKIAESSVTKTKLETEAKLIEGSKKLAEKLGVKINDNFNSVEEINEYLKETGSEEKFSNQYGSFFKNKKTGQNEIIINRAAALKDGVITTDAHEVFHAVLFETVKNSPETQEKLGAALYNELLNIDKDQVSNSEFNLRLASYLEDASKGEGTTNDALEEALTLFSEATLNGDIKFEENLFTKIGDFLRQTFTRSGVAAKFNNGRDVYNFIKDYNKSLLKNKISEKVIATAKKGATGTLVSNKTTNAAGDFKKDSKFSSANNATQSQIEASKKAQKLYEKIIEDKNTLKDLDANLNKNLSKEEADIIQKQKNKIEASIGQGTFDILTLFEPSVDRIVNKYKNRPAFNQNKDLLRDNLLTESGGVLDMINKYNPKINDSLGAYINTYLERRAITIADRLLGKNEASTFKSDVTEVKDVMATETAEDAIIASEEIAKEKPKKEKPKLKETINFPAELTTEITTAVEKFASLASKGFTEEQSKNRTSANYVNDIKADLAESLRKPIAKYIKEQGLEQFLIENRGTILDNFTTTFLSKHPFFRKGILKRVNGEWVAPTRISAYKYDWVDANGNKLKIDRDNAAGRGLTSGPEFIKRNPKIKEILKENEYVDYHFQDGALRNKIKVNALDSLSRQLASEIGFEILQEDILSNGPITQKIGERASVYGIEFSDSLAEKVATSLERGNIKFSKAGLRSIINTKLDPNQYYNFVGLDNAKIKEFSRKAFFEGDINKIPAIFDEVYPDLNINKETKDEIVRVWQVFYQRRKTYLGLKEQKISRTKLANKFSDYINDLVFESQSIEESIKSLTSFDISKLTSEEKQKTALSILNNFQNYLHTVENKTNVDAAKIAIRAFGRAFANGKSSFLKNNSTVYDLFITKNNSLTEEEIAQFDLKDVIGGKSIYFKEENVKGKFYVQSASASDIDVEDTSKIDIIGRNNLSKDAKDDVELIIKFLKHAYDVNEDNTDIGKISGQELAIAATGLLSNMSTSLKLAAKLEYIARIPGKVAKQYVYEHITPSSYLARAIIGYTMGLDNSVNFDQVINILENSKVALVPKSFDNILVKGKLQQRFPKSYKIGENPLYRYFNAYFKNKFPKLVLENIIEGKPDITFENFKRLPDKPGDLQKFSKSMNTTFNEMLERKKGVLATETISKATAKLQGQGKGKLKVFVPPSADDFVGLLYNFLGTGKQGDADMQFFEEKLLRPLAKANSQLNGERQAIKQRWQEVVKSNKGITKVLRKESDYKYYTNDHAVRTWMWDRLGYDIPGISETDKAKLIDSVNSSEKLLKFAEELIDVPNKTESWLQPEADWTASTVEMDLQEILSKIGRARIFEEFITNADIIFSEDNLNKIEAAYGSKLRGALEDMLYRIEKGRARNEGGNKMASAYLDWVRGSVATTMFFNTRSALLQQLSIVNFTNWEDNNIFAQGKFIATNPKTYAKYWVDIFNSDWMKERRQGLKTDINESELVARLEGSKNKNKALLAYMLEKGFSLTKYGDNIAIATGGAPFLYNREQKYIKEGMTEAKAKEEAFLDFQEIAERTQQSSRQDLLSNQQVSVIGRIFLAFQNTTMQMTRLQKKAALDLINRRGSFKANVSRLVYYGAVQNTIFSFLQNALFAGIFGDDEDENLKLDDKALRAANTVLDSALRGSGIGGAALATLKNAIIAWAKENDKGWNADNSKVIIELLNISPAVGIKARKINNAMNAYKYGKKVIDDVSLTNPNHPYYGIAGSLTSAAFNIPLDRVVTKAQNLQALTNQEAEAWQRTALFLGYNTWDLGLKDPEIEAARKMASKKKKKSKNW